MASVDIVRLAFRALIPTQCDEARILEAVSVILHERAGAEAKDAGSGEKLKAARPEDMLAGMQKQVIPLRRRSNYASRQGFWRSISSARRAADYAYVRYKKLRLERCHRGLKNTGA